MNCLTTSPTPNDEATTQLLSQARDLRQLFGYPTDSGEACDHSQHQTAFREAFNLYTEASEQYYLPGIIEYMALCTLILLSYKTDAGDATQIDYDGMMHDFSTAAIAFDINLTRAVTALIDSEKTKLVTSQMLEKTQLSYALMNIHVDFTHRHDTRFTCFNKITGETLPGVEYTQPDWENISHWTRIRPQAA